MRQLNSFTCVNKCFVIFGIKDYSASASSNNLQIQFRNHDLKSRPKFFILQTLGISTLRDGRKVVTEWDFL